MNGSKSQENGYTLGRFKERPGKKVNELYESFSQDIRINNKS